MKLKMHSIAPLLCNKLFFFLVYFGTTEVVVPILILHHNEWLQTEDGHVIDERACQQVDSENSNFFITGHFCISHSFYHVHLCSNQ